MRRIVIAAAAAIFLIIVAVVGTRVSIVAIQPHDGLPDGVTLVMWRVGHLQFFDSAEAVCQRRFDVRPRGCRIGAAEALIGERGRTLFRLPYSDWVHSLSIDDATA